MHDFSNMMRTLTRNEGFGETVVITTKSSGAVRTVSACIRRRPITVAPEAQEAHVPEILIDFEDHAFLGLPAASLDVRLYRLTYAPIRGGATVTADITRQHDAPPGKVTVEI